MRLPFTAVKKDTLMNRLTTFLFYTLAIIFLAPDAMAYMDWPDNDGAPGSLWTPILLFAAMFWFYKSRKK
jgi:hypothetical protein